MSTFPPVHRVSIVVDGSEVSRPLSYEITNSLLDASDSFSFVGAWSREMWELCRTDRPVRVIIDGTTRITGYIDSRRKQSSDGTITITGRDKIGRMVQESAPQVNFSGLTLKSLAEKIAIAPHLFQSVVFSNAKNRKVLRGKGHKARDSGHVYVDQAVGTRIEPGQARMAVLNDLLEQAAYSAWSSGDGRQLIIGQPDYRQEVQYRFVQAAQGSSRSSNVEDMSIEDSVADRFSRYLYLGAGPGTDANYGIAPSTRYGEAKDVDATADGTGRDFSQPKILIVSDRHDLSSRKEARRRAAREKARRDMKRHTVSVIAPMHGQLVEGSEITLFAPDTLAFVEDEEIGLSGVYLVASCRYRANRDIGEVTDLELLPRGTEIVT